MTGAQRSLAGDSALLHHADPHAQRFRNGAAAASNSFRTAVDAVRADAGDRLRVDLFGAADIIALVAQSTAGDAHASAFLRVIADARRSIDAASRHDPATCACCPAPIYSGQRRAYGVISPAAGPVPGSNALVFLLCGPCMARPDLPALLPGVMARIWPDFCGFAVPHPGTGVLQ